MQVLENEWISKRAYTLWESEGHPHGRDADHWQQAHHEFSLLKSSKATKPVQRQKAEPKNAATEASSIDNSEKPKRRAGKQAGVKPV